MKRKNSIFKKIKIDRYAVDMEAREQINIFGRNLPLVKNVVDLVQQDTQILIFPRHLGCSLTKHLVAEILRLEVKYKTAFPITFVCHGSVDYSDRFWQSWSPKARVVFDTDLTIAKSFGLKEGTLRHALDIKTMYCSFKAIAAGHPTDVDKSSKVFMLPGIFIYRDGQEVFKHIARTAGDMPDFENLVLSHIKF